MDELKADWKIILVRTVAATMIAVALVKCAFGQQLANPQGLAMTAQRIELGHKLFWDSRLSADNSVACASCHDPRSGWSDNLPLAKGIRGQIGTRNSPTVLNAAFSPRQFWDGRTADLSNQSLQPLVNAIEMGNDSEGQVLQRIRDIPGYRQLFAQAYGPINRDTFAHALASFESQIVTLDDTPLHRRMAGDLTALSPAAEKGFGLASKANCFSCHSGNQFTNFAFANNGSEVATRNQGNDLGRFAINGRDDRIRAFKTPSWVELERTKPYMHNGAMPDLERVVMHYSVGGARFDGVRDPYSDPRIVAQNWTPKQRSYVVTLLRDGTKSPTYPSFDQPTLP